MVFTADQFVTIATAVINAFVELMTFLTTLLGKVA